MSSSTASPPVRFEDLTFPVPDGWTVSAVMSAPSDGKEGFRPNVVFSTDRRRQGESFTTYVDRQLIELARKLKQFSLKKRLDVVVGAVHGVQFVVGWSGTQGLVEQWITMFPRGDEIRTVTATSLKKGGEAMRLALDELLAGLAIDAER